MIEVEILHLMIDVEIGKCTGITTDSLEEEAKFPRRWLNNSLFVV